MKNLPVIIALLAVCAWSTTVFSRGAAKPAPISGVVTEVNTGYFLATLDKGIDSKVYVTGNTIFQLNGAKSDASYVKAGVHIKLSGTSDDGLRHIEAILVNVISGGKPSKSKSE